MLRQDPDRIRASQKARGESESLVDDLVTADEDRRAAIAQYEGLRAEQKVLGKRVSRAQGEEKSELLARTKELSVAVKDADAAQGKAGADFDAMFLQVANIVEDAAPVGGEDDFVVIETHGAPRDFAAEGFEPRDHLEIGELLAAIDTERGAKVSGSRFY